MERKKHILHARWACWIELFLLPFALRHSARAQTTGSLLQPTGIAYDAAGNLYIADGSRHQIFEATLAGSLIVIAGTGAQGYAGDGGPATAAQLNDPQDVIVGADGTVYIADTGNARVRAVTAGVITTLTGTGQPIYAGDGGPVSAASFRTPAALAFDSGGGLLLCDTADHRVRRLGLGSGGLASTVAGTGVQGFAGDGGPASAAELDSPAGLAVAADGRVFIADTHNQRVRLVSSTGVISTYAGTGQRGMSGDGGQAAAAQLANPRGLAMMTGGTLLIGDADNQRLRQIDPGGVIRTLAGAGMEGTSVDGSAAASAALRAPHGLAVSSFGLPTFADTLNGTLRVLTPAGTLFQPAAVAAGRAGSTVQANLRSGPAGAQVYGPLSASVVVNGPVGTAQGLVTLSEGGNPVGSASLSGGTAAVTTLPLAAGEHTLLAGYGGDGLNPAAEAGVLTVQVNPLAVDASADNASVVYGVAAPALTGTLGGVLPQDVGQVNAMFSSAAGALAPVGVYPITATLTGPKSANYTVHLASSSGSLQITAAGSLTALAGLVQGYAGLPLRLSANVASTTQGRPTGTVQFLDAGTPVASGTLVNGSVSGVYVAPAAGAHSLTAVYSGDGNFLPSSSASQTASVGALPDFSLGLNGAASVTALPGATAMYNLLISAQPAPFTGNVTLAATGLPAGATASFSPVQVVPGAGSANVILTVQLPAVQAQLRSGRRPVVAFCGAILLCGFVLRRTHRLGAALSLSIACLCLAGCGARTVSEGEGGLTSTTYTLQITGTSTNLIGAVVTHSMGATLVVQQ